MFGFTQFTATYSNAVLTTLLPVFSDFVKKVDLPMPTPITIQQVERFVPYPQRANIGGGYLVLTNGLELWYSHGHVEGFRTPRSYYHLQGNFNEDVRRFYGPVKPNKDAALQPAR